ncbi:MAG: LPS assembly protein LptD [Paracoccaceae bacterium]|nr:LPS assembly protein LptD [Paracoccaceae bacterium]
MPRLFGIFLAFFMLCFGAATAQPASLVADEVQISDGIITATGHVQVTYEDISLRADRISYNSVTEELVIEGGMILTDGEDMVVVADGAQLDGDLGNGVIRGARMVLDQQLQIAAAELNRVDGRYTQLYRTTASSCQVCADRPVPLWEIRADRVVHDQQERQLYFYNAHFRLMDLPIFYVPRLRMPDPTLKRATGFLIPAVKTSSLLGAGIKIPYFITIGDHADITLTPYVSSKTKTLQARYRQAFYAGDVVFNTAVSEDELQAGLRAYLFGQGRFHLSRNYQLDFDVELTSDPAYLLDYGFSGKDRLDSAVSLTRTGRNEYLRAGAVAFQTLRGSELAIEDQLPNLQAEAYYTRRFFPAAIGGQGRWYVGIQGHNRDSDADQLGRDVLQLHAGADWSRGEMFGPGVMLRYGGGAAGDLYAIAHDSDYEPLENRLTANSFAELRWPLVASRGNGVTDLLQPLVQVGWSEAIGTSFPNEDSTLSEFDEGNLLALSRFAGDDAVETGLRASAGMRWSRFTGDGLAFGIVFGQIYRDEAIQDYTPASGLDGYQSDWLIAGKIRLDSRLSAEGRMLLSSQQELTKGEARLGWSSERLQLASTYSWIVADELENRPDPTSQMRFESDYSMSRNWVLGTDLNYDFDAERATSAGIGLTFRNECVNVDLSLSRRFTSSASVTPTTDVGLSFSLNGFGRDGRRYRQPCS